MLLHGPQVARCESGGLIINRYLILLCVRRIFRAWCKLAGSNATASGKIASLYAVMCVDHAVYWHVTRQAGRSEWQRQYAKSEWVRIKCSESASEYMRVSYSTSGLGPGMTLSYCRPRALLATAACKSAHPIHQTHTHTSP